MSQSAFTNGLGETYWITVLIVFIAYYSLSVYIGYRIGRKFGIGSFWEWCIPIYNSVLLCRCAGLSGWNVLWFFLPLANFVFAVYLWGTLAERLGHSFWLYGLGIFVFGIPVFVLAFDSSTCVDVPARQQAGGAAIKCVWGEFVGQVVDLDSNGIVIGRSAARAHLVLSKLEVSGTHARVWPDGSGAGVWVQDMGSENGTFVAQQNRYGLPPEWIEVRGPQLLARGTHFRLGDNIAEFEVT